jgi:hypothetical protein
MSAIRLLAALALILALSACAGSSAYTVPPLTHDQRCVSEEDSLGRARENFVSFVRDQLAGYGDFFQTVDEAESYLDREGYVLKDYRPKAWQHARELERDITSWERKLIRDGC